MVGLPSGRQVLACTVGFEWGTFAGRKTLPIIVAAVLASFAHCIGKSSRVRCCVGRPLGAWCAVCVTGLAVHTVSEVDVCSMICICAVHLCTCVATASFTQCLYYSTAHADCIHFFWSHYTKKPSGKNKLVLL